MCTNHKIQESQPYNKIKSVYFQNQIPLKIRVLQPENINV